MTTDLKGQNVSARTSEDDDELADAGKARILFRFRTGDFTAQIENRGRFYFRAHTRAFLPR